jgi:hypothetical protein
MEHGKRGRDREAELATAYIEKKRDLVTVLEEVVDFFNCDIKAIAKSTFYEQAKLDAASKELLKYEQTRAIDEPGLKQKNVTYSWLCDCMPDAVRLKFIGHPDVINALLTKQKAVKAFMKKREQAWDTEINRELVHFIILYLISDYLIHVIYFFSS